MILILIDLINIPIFCQSGKSDQLQTLMAWSFWRWTLFYMLTSNMIIWKRQINILYKISLSIMAYWESFKKGYISIKTRWTSPRTWPTSKGMHWLSRDQYPIMVPSVSIQVLEGRKPVRSVPALPPHEMTWEIFYLDIAMWLGILSIQIPWWVWSKHRRCKANS